MSYILDALKRADAERERGAVPGLHSQTAGAIPAPAHAPADGRRPWRAALGLGALLLLAALAWWFSRPATPPPAQVLATAPSSPATSVSAPSPLPAPAVPAPAQASAPTAHLPGAGPAPVAPAPILRPQTPVVAAAPAQDPPSRVTVAPPAALSAPAKAREDETVDAGVRRFADLSPEQRAQLPQLSVNGASYSANPAHRMLIVNGSVVQEGQEIAPGLVLERIGPHLAVLRHAGLRYSIAY